MPKKVEAPIELEALFKELRAEARSVAEDLASHIEEVRVLGYMRHVGCVIIAISALWVVIEIASPWGPLRIFGLLGALIFAALGGGFIFIGSQFLANYNYLRKKYSRILRLTKTLGK